MMKTIYGKKVVKLPIDLNVTCPNRDGTKGYGGCTFCLCGSGSNHNDLSVDDQYRMVKTKISHKWHDFLTMPFFQSYSNTYCQVDYLKQCIDALKPFQHEMVGISIATRADCINDDMWDYLNGLNHQLPVWLEIGVQSSNDSTMAKLNRLHDFNDVIKTINIANDCNIHTVLHIINGLPGETKQDMIQTIKAINPLHPTAIKIHMLNILKKTAMAKDYMIQPWPLLSLEEYTDIVIEQLGYLDPTIMIQRLTGDGFKEDLIAPLWISDKKRVLNTIDIKMRQSNRYQGDRFNG